MVDILEKETKIEALNYLQLRVITFLEISCCSHVYHSLFSYNLRFQLYFDVTLFLYCCEVVLSGIEVCDMQKNACNNEKCFHRRKIVMKNALLAIINSVSFFS